MSSKQARIKALVRSASGSSLPWYCVLEDESPWLVKFSGAGPGVSALLAEHIANTLGRHWGLPIPESKPVLLESSVPRAGTDEFWDVLAASEGWNLAIRTIPGAVNVVPDTDLPQSTLESMLAYDTLLANWDRTALSWNLMRDDSEALWWIDHGSCRFLHNLESPRPLLPSTHFLFEEQEHIEGTRLPMLDREAIEDMVAELPEEWLARSGFDSSRLASRLFDYLQEALG